MPGYMFEIVMLVLYAGSVWAAYGFFDALAPQPLHQYTAKQRSAGIAILATFWPVVLAALIARMFLGVFKQ